MVEQSSNHRSNKFVGILVALIVIVALVIGWLVLSPSKPAEAPAPMVSSVPALPTVTPPPPETSVEPVEEAPPPEPAVEAPEQPAEPAMPPLPSLNESDASIVAFADELDPLQRLSALLIPDRVLLKFVRAVIALDEGNVVKDYRPVQSPAPPMKVVAIEEPLDIEVGQRYRVDPQNYARYNAYVDALVEVDKKRLAALYHYYYPLLDEAYLQYGVDRGGFLNVTLRAIDAVNAVKIDDYNAVLIQPKVFYDFQDPQLQAKSGPYKLLFRFGPENTAKVQSALKVLRQELVKPR